MGFGVTDDGKANFLSYSEASQYENVRTVDNHDDVGKSLEDASVSGCGCIA